MENPTGTSNLVPTNSREFACGFFPGRNLGEECNMKHTKNLVCSAALMLLGAALAAAQSDRGTITGTVTDPANSAVPGGQLVLRNIDTGAVREAKTTPTGNFT